MRTNATVKNESAPVRQEIAQSENTFVKSRSRKLNSESLRQFKGFENLEEDEAGQICSSLNILAALLHEHLIGSHSEL